LFGFGHQVIVVFLLWSPGDCGFGFSHLVIVIVWLWSPGDCLDLITW
jgi:hypothetical protein